MTINRTLSLAVEQKKTEQKFETKVIKGTFDSDVCCCYKLVILLLS